MNRLSYAIVPSVFVVTALLAACGGATDSAPPATPAAASTPAPAPAAPAMAWADSLTQEQKVAIMKTSVVPRVGPLFQAADAQRYTGFGCKSCHGPDGMKAPTEYLPHLTMKDGKLTCFTDKADVSKFMAQKVVPEMASALGVKPFDPATHTGFGCPGCHTVDQK